MSNSVNENSVIEASIQGNRNAFREIVAKYQSLVCSVAYSVTGDLAESEDLAQETFIVAWQKLDSLEDRTKLSSWLCGIVKNIARDTHRKSKRDLSYDATPLDEAVAAVNAVRMTERVTESERESVMWAALEEIPENYREPLILFYRRGESIREVAQALDISEDAAKQRLSRGRKMLKEQVAAFVEKSLIDTNPGKAFTIAVIATLPILTSSTAAAAMTSGGITGSSIVGNGTVKVAFWTAFFGSIAFMTLGLFNMWLVIRAAPDAVARRQVIRNSARAISLFWTVLGLLSLAGMFASEVREYLIAGLAMVIFVVVGATAIFIVRSGRTSATGDDSTRIFMWTATITLAASTVFVIGTSWYALPFLVVSHVACAVMFRKGWRLNDGMKLQRDRSLDYSPKWSLIISTAIVVVAIPFVKQFCALVSEGEFTAALGFAPMILTIPLVLLSAVVGILEAAKSPSTVRNAVEHSVCE